ncbi:hypothetical protein BTE77_32505 [Ensifer adhaerens]|nr:hypothetical protein BTE77_32505 [Ensifer adhaerens]
MAATLNGAGLPIKASPSRRLRREACSLQERDVRLQLFAGYRDGYGNIGDARLTGKKDLEHPAADRVGKGQQDVIKGCGIRHRCHPCWTRSDPL